MSGANETIEQIQSDADADIGEIWTALLGGVEGAASWLFESGQGTSAQYRDFGNQLLDRAAEYSQRILSLAEGVGNSIERTSMIQSAQSISTYVTDLRASGVEAIESAGRAAANAARNARVGAIAGASGAVLDGYQYFKDLHSAITDGSWEKFGSTAASMGAGAATGALASSLAISALAALAAVITVPAGVAAGIIFAVGVGGAFIGASFGSMIYDGWRGIADLVATHFRASQLSASPLILDLDGDGIEITQHTGAITFDHDANGIETGTAWAGADDGLLVLDRDGNGNIDTGRELFGNNTLLANGQKAADGYAALRELDSNADGVLDASDAAFANLRVWRDLDQDGNSDAGELFSLNEVGVSQIGLSKAAFSQTLADGTRLDGLGSFVIDGQTRSYTDAWFAENPFYREFASDIELSQDVAALPGMKGSGAVRDLQEAAMLSEPLRDLLEQF